jgi:hypothetical protein
LVQLVFYLRLVHNRDLTFNEALNFQLFSWQFYSLIVKLRIALCGLVIFKYKIMDFLVDDYLVLS